VLVAPALSTRNRMLPLSPLRTLLPRVMTSNRAASGHELIQLPTIIKVRLLGTRRQSGIVPGDSLSPRSGRGRGRSPVPVPDLSGIGGAPPSPASPFAADGDAPPSPIPIAGSAPLGGAPGARLCVCLPVCTHVCVCVRVATPKDISATAAISTSGSAKSESAVHVPFMRPVLRLSLCMQVPGADVAFEHSRPPTAAPPHLLRDLCASWQNGACGPGRSRSDSQSSACLYRSRRHLGPPTTAEASEVRTQWAAARCTARRPGAVGRPSMRARQGTSRRSRSRADSVSVVDRGGCTTAHPSPDADVVRFCAHLVAGSLPLRPTRLVSYRSLPLLGSACCGAGARHGTARPALRTR
jgi:hypothetical protein